MDINLEKLKINFLKIKDVRSNVTSVFKILESHLLDLKNMYSEFVENNKQNVFVFGLDSFQFQNKLIDIEYDDMKRLFLAINNRMYCEYYKLHKIIAEFVKENIPDKKTSGLIKISNTFSVYKDLEPYKQYKFEIIQEIHENIILLLYEINEFILNKENELQLHKKKQEIGLNINNFVMTFNYNIIIIKEKGILFMSYIDFFHNLHTKYLQRFTMKMNLMYTQVTHDIRFDEYSKKKSLQKKELINEFETDNIDKTLIKELKGSFYDTDSSNSDSPIKIEITEKKEKNISDLTKNEICLNTNTVNNKLNNSSDKLRDVFKNNVTNIINGLRVFKNKNKNIKKDTITSSSSDGSLDDTNKNIKVDLLDIYELKNDLTMRIEKTKSAEEIFMEISQQCLELVDNKNNKINNINDIKTESLLDVDFTDNIIILDNNIQTHIGIDANNEENESMSILTIESQHEIVENINKYEEIT